MRNLKPDDRPRNVRLVADPFLILRGFDKSIRVTLTDFFAYMPGHSYIFRPARDLWPAASVDGRLPRQLDAERKRRIRPSQWLDRYRAVEQMTWAPGEPELIEDRVIDVGGGWITRPGCRVYNLYRAPAIDSETPGDPQRWLDHVAELYGSEAAHIIYWLAHRVQRPGEKINHALVLGGAQGIGKDSILEPVSHAVGSWNVREASPMALLGRFNPFLKSVILRVSEARDLGDVNRYQLYDATKVITAAPPDVLRIDEKNRGEYAIPNVTGVIITTNHKGGALYLPADDRRHFVAWSPKTKEDFPPTYFESLWRWYRAGGNTAVAAYLRSLDLSQFDPKAPPTHTAAFWDIVDSNRAPECAELADVLDALASPRAVTIALVAERARDLKLTSLGELLTDKKLRKQVPHRFEEVGYIRVRNDNRPSDGLWKVGTHQAVYARADLSLRDRIIAAQQLASQQD